jgi:hypothetical protein
MCGRCGYDLGYSADGKCPECGLEADPRWHDWRRAAVVAERLPVLYAVTRFCLPLRTAISFFAVAACLVFSLSALSLRTWTLAFSLLCAAQFVQAWAMAAPVALLRMRYCDEFPKRLFFALLPLSVYPIALTVLFAATGPLHPLAVAVLGILGGIARSQHQYVLYTTAELYIQAGATQYVESAERTRSTLKGVFLALLVVFVAQPLSMVLRAQIGVVLSIILVWDFVDSRIANYNHEYLWLGSIPGNDSPAKS